MTAQCCRVRVCCHHESVHVLVPSQRAPADRLLVSPVFFVLSLLGLCQRLGCSDFSSGRTAVIRQHQPSSVWPSFSPVDLLAAAVKHKSSQSTNSFLTAAWALITLPSEPDAPAKVLGTDWSSVASPSCRIGSFCCGGC